MSVVNNHDGSYDVHFDRPVFVTGEPMQPFPNFQLFNASDGWQACGAEPQGPSTVITVDEDEGNDNDTLWQVVGDVPQLVPQPVHPSSGVIT